MAIVHDPIEDSPCQDPLFGGCRETDITTSRRSDRRAPSPLRIVFRYNANRPGDIAFRAENAEKYQNRVFAIEDRDDLDDS